MSQVQPDEDKVRALETIFGGHDLSSSVIRTVLSTNGNKFDESVDILLGMSNSPSDPISVEEETQDAVREKKHREQLSALQSMFGGDLTTSVICTVLDVNKGEMMDTVDTLLNMTSSDLNPRQEQKQLKDMRSEAERLRQEQELKHFEDFQKLQAQLRQQEAEARSRAVRDQELAKAKSDREAREHASLLQEQQRILAEYELEKAKAAASAKELEQKKLAAVRLVTEEQNRRLAEEQSRQAAARLLEEHKAKASLEKQQAAARLAEDQRRVKAHIEAQAIAEAERSRLEADRKEAEKRESDRKELEKREIERREAEKKDSERRAAIENERRIFEEECRRERARTEQIQREVELEQKKRIEEEKLRLVEERVRIAEERKRIEAKKREEERLAEEQRAKLQSKYYEEQEALKRSWDNKFKALHDEEERLYQRKIKEEEEFRLKLATEEKRLAAMLEQERNRIAEELRVKAEKEQLEQERRREEAELKLKLEQQAEADRLELERIALEQAQAIAEEEKKLKQAEAALIASTVILSEAAVEASVCKLTIEVDGTEVKGTWEHEGVPNAYDWVALFKVRQTNNRKYTHSQYATTNKGNFTFKKVTPGRYEVRYFQAKSYEPSMKSETVLVGPVATITTQLNGDQLMVQYTIEPPTTHPRSTWVAVYEKSQIRNKLYLATQYGNEQNYVCHKAPRTPGEYEVRLFVNGSNYNEQAFVSFTVEDHDFVSTSVKEIEGGAPLTVKYQVFASGAEPSTSDWIGIFEGDQPNTKYLASAYTTGSSSGEVVIPAPKASGVYECRLFSHGLGKYNLYRKSEPFTVLLTPETAATPSSQ